jgi:predicted HicB family RNase H-like nuclease
MLDLIEREPMAKKKSETRKHTAMVRIDDHARDRAQLAASLMRMSLADYVSDLVLKAAEKDIAREAKKLAEGGSDQ